MEKKTNLFHPYNLAVLVAVVSFGTLIYVGLVAPTPESGDVEVKGITTETELYTKTQLRDYGADLLIRDQSGTFGDKYLDQQEIEFTAYSEATVTYDLFKLKNNTNDRVSLRITPKAVINPNMRNLTVQMLIDSGTFELYSFSQEPNQDFFAISLDPYESEDLKISVTADALDTETAKGEILFQIAEM